jgi:hypothetical protein
MKLEHHQTLRLTEIIDITLTQGETLFNAIQSQAVDAINTTAEEREKKKKNLRRKARTATLASIADTVDFTCNDYTSAVIINGTVGSFNIFKDLFAHANAGMMNTIRERPTSNEFNQKDKPIEGNTKEFLYQWTQTNEWLCNSYSMRQPDFASLETFDREELKARLQKLIDIL